LIATLAHVTLAHEAVALALTLAIEIPVYAMLLSAVVGVAPRRAAAYGVVANVASHPLSFLVLAPAIASVLGETAGIVTAEIVVAWVGEAMLVRGLTRADVWTALGVAFVANALSFAVGLVALRA
jgi:hypothetical protein